MSDPVIEQIALVVVERLATITEANGYNQTASQVKRVTRIGKGYSPLHLSIIVWQENADRDELNCTDGNPSAIAYDQLFCIGLITTASDKDETPSDTIKNRFEADAIKAICVDNDWMQFGGLAKNAWFGNKSRWPNTDGTEDGVLLRLFVKYRTSQVNPYINV